LAGYREGGDFMDVIYLTIGILFFILCRWLISALDRL
jgi:hypothetical protein